MADAAITEKKSLWAKWGDGVTFSVDKDDVATVNVIKETYIDNCGGAIGEFYVKVISIDSANDAG